MFDEFLEKERNPIMTLLADRSLIPIALVLLLVANASAQAKRSNWEYLQAKG